MGWTEADPHLSRLGRETRARLERQIPRQVPRGAVLFRPGDSVQGFVIVLSGRIEVCLTGPTGRDIMLYEVVPGQSCVQSTLGLLGGEDYSAEARTETDAEIVLLPREQFLGLIDASPDFRRLVFSAFAERMQSMMHLLEKVAFLRVEARLAQALLDRADASGRVSATQAELASLIGSAREVVSRRLTALAGQGVLRLERGAVILTDRELLAARAAAGEM